MLNYLSNLPKPFFVLAPMDEVTETVFRQIVQACAPADLYFTEFVNVDGLQSPGRSRLLKKLRFSANEGPLIAQLWGLKPENFEAIARQIADGSMAKELCRLNDVTGSLHGDAAQGDREERSKPYKSTVMRAPQQVNAAIRPDAASMSGFADQQGQPMHTCPNFAGIDINMGCPAKSEVGNGACSALINNRPLASEIIKATQRGAGENMPVSVKTRIGFSTIDLTWIEFLLQHNLSMLTVHFRTRKEMSKVPAHWELAGDIVALRNTIAPDTKISGNGDVLDKAHGEVLASQYGVDGVMIGRGIFQNPYAFAKDASQMWEQKSVDERIELLRKHVTLFDKTWGDERRYDTLKKFAKVYISGFDGAKEYREQIMATTTANELLMLLSTSNVVKKPLVVN